MTNVNKEMLHGAGWMMLFKLSHRGLGFISIVILARILLPSDFGLVAMATAIIAMLELMWAFGFDVALIQKQDAQRRHYDTVWTFNIIFSSCIAIILIVLASPAAAFYEEPRLANIIRVLALSTLILGLENVGVVLFRKELEFNKEFYFMLAKRLVRFLATIPLAFALRSYWALVLGILISNSGGVVLSYVMQPYRPRLTLVAARELLGFSKWLLLNNVLFFIRSRSMDFIVGKLSGTYALGILRFAHEISELPTTEMVQPINRAALPGYSKLNSDSNSIRFSYLNVVSAVGLFAIPAGIGVSVTAELFVPILLGNNWMDAIPLIEIIAVASSLVALQSNNGTVYYSIGKPKIVTALAAVSAGIMLPLVIVLTARHGIYGTAWATAIAVIVMLPVNYLVVCRVLNLRLSGLIRALWRSLAAAAVMWPACAVTKSTLISGAYITPQPLTLALVLTTLCGVTTYFTCVFGLWLLTGRPAGAESFLADRLRRTLSRHRWFQRLMHVVRLR